MITQRKKKNIGTQKDQNKSTAQGYYMYSVIDKGADQSFGLIGLSETEEGSEVFTVSYNDISCVVSNSPVKEWDLTRGNMVKHQKVNEIVMEEHVVLPIKFCTIAKSKEKIVEKFLKRRYKELKKNLNYFAGKQEHGVRPLWVDMEKTYVRLLNENPNLKKWRDRLSKMPFEKARNDMIILGQRIKGTLRQMQDDLETRLFKKLRPLAVKGKRNKLIGDRMVMNGVFLIAQADQAEFDTMVAQLVDRLK